MKDMNSNRRTELAAFLRGQARPAQPAPSRAARGGRPGKAPYAGAAPPAEVAQLVGLSVDYYIRLGQARGPHPSRQVLAALAGR